MPEGIRYTGVPSEEELRSCRGLPSERRMALGPVAAIECLECIPCDPCERACPQGAIIIGDPMTNAPALDENRCIGCGECIAKCPGLAITVINKAAGGGLAELDFPYEYLPLPMAGDAVEAVDREGTAVCSAKVLSVTKRREDKGTRVIRISFPAEFAGKVKSIRRAYNG